MDNDRIESLIERVRRIERWCITWGVLVIGAWLAIAMLFILKAVQRSESPGTILARDFVVVDGTGRPLIRLGRCDEALGKAAFEFLDSEGSRRIVIAIGKADAPYLSIMDPNTGDQLVLDVQPQHGTAVAFRNRRSQSGLLLAAGPPGVAAVGFMDKDGNRMVEIGVEPDGSARLTIRSKEGKKLFEVP